MACQFRILNTATTQPAQSSWQTLWKGGTISYKTMVYIHRNIKILPGFSHWYYHRKIRSASPYSHLWQLADCPFQHGQRKFIAPPRTWKPPVRRSADLYSVLTKWQTLEVNCLVYWTMLLHSSLIKSKQHNNSWSNGRHRQISMLLFR